MKLKVLAVLYSTTLIWVLAIQLGFVVISASAISLFSITVSLTYAWAALLVLGAALTLFSWVHCRTIVKRVKHDYQLAYRTCYKLMDVAADRVYELTHREEEDAKVAKTFQPGIMNKPVDCGRYRLRDGTLSARLMVTLPWQEHVGIAWYSAKRVLLNSKIYWELVPLLILVLILLV